MTIVQIKQTIGQLEASIKKIEPFISSNDFQTYCDHVYSMIVIWRVVLKQVNEANKDED